MSDIYSVLLRPEKDAHHGIFDEGPCGFSPPGIRYFRRSTIKHEENWDDTTCPVSLCNACSQPWPCETPGQEDVRREEQWLPRAPGSSAKLGFALPLAWHGKSIRQSAFIVDGIMRDMKAKELVGWWIIHNLSSRLVDEIIGDAEDIVYQLRLLKEFLDPIGTVILLNKNDKVIANEG